MSNPHQTSEYRLRCMPYRIRRMLQKKQEELNKEKGYFHSLERVIYILLEKEVKTKEEKKDKFFSYFA